jgi:hypothetical protein
VVKENCTLAIRTIASWLEEGPEEIGFDLTGA